MTEDADLHRYVAANAVLDMHLHGRVRNESVTPHWLGDSGAFWYRRESDTGGAEFMMVTPDGVRVPVSDQAPDANTPTAPGMLVSPDGKWAVFTHDDNLVVRELKTGSDRKLTSDGEPYYSWGKAAGRFSDGRRAQAGGSLGPAFPDVLVSRLTFPGRPSAR
jgi:hypothetical protein